MAAVADGAVLTYRGRVHHGLAGEIVVPVLTLREIHGWASTVCGIPSDELLGLNAREVLGKVADCIPLSGAHLDSLALCDLAAEIIASPDFPPDHLAAVAGSKLAEAVADLREAHAAELLKRDRAEKEESKRNARARAELLGDYETLADELAHKLDPSRLWSTEELIEAVRKLELGGAAKTVFPVGSRVRVSTGHDIDELSPIEPPCEQPAGGWISGPDALALLRQAHETGRHVEVRFRLQGQHSWQAVVCVTELDAADDDFPVRLTELSRSALPPSGAAVTASGWQRVAPHVYDTWIESARWPVEPEGEDECVPTPGAIATSTAGPFVIADGDTCSRASSQASSSVVRAMRRAACAFNAADRHTFNAAGFSAALCDITGLAGPLDGLVVELMLADRTDVESVGGGTFLLKPWGAKREDEPASSDRDARWLAVLERIFGKGSTKTTGVWEGDPLSYWELWGRAALEDALDAHKIKVLGDVVKQRTVPEPSDDLAVGEGWTYSRSASEHCFTHPSGHHGVFDSFEADRLSLADGLARFEGEGYELTTPLPRLLDFLGRSGVLEPFQIPDADALRNVGEDSAGAIELSYLRADAALATKLLVELARFEDETAEAPEAPEPTAETAEEAHARQLVVGAKVRVSSRHRRHHGCEGVVEQCCSGGHFVVRITSRIAGADLVTFSAAELELIRSTETLP